MPKKEQPIKLERVAQLRVNVYLPRGTDPDTEEKVVDEAEGIACRAADKISDVLKRMSFDDFDVEIDY